MTYDPVICDPLEIDREYPPAMLPVKFESSKDLVIGIMLLANGRGPHPTVLLLHGFPGYEKNYDLAQVFRRNGWNVMIFHYRGAWGSRGSFSFRNVLDDISAALDFVKQEEACDLYRVDPDRIALVGYSMGGGAALLSAVSHPDLKAVVSIAGFSMGLDGRMMKENPDMKEFRMSKMEENILPLQGTSANSLVDEMMTYSYSLDYINYAEIISQKPVFMIGAGNDKVVPIDIHHTPMVHAIKKYDPGFSGHIILDTDHVFSDKRIELARIITSWLQQKFNS